MRPLYQRAILVVFLSVCAFGLVVPVGADAGSTASETPDVAIDSALDGSTDEQTVIVRLSERPQAAMQATSQDQQPAALKAHADETQSAFEQFADGNPHVEIEEQFWITNAILVTVDLDKVSLAQLGTVDNVEAIHEDVEIETTSTRVEIGNASAMQPNVSTTTTDSYTWGLEAINVPETWDTFDNRGDGVRVAVLDTGVDPDHPDIDVAGWKDFTDGNAADPKDYGSHGTHVSGIVVGGDASGQYIGVAPDAELYHGAVLSPEDSSMSNVWEGIQWAIEEDADVVSMSLGAINTEYLSESIDPIRNARESGTIPVVSSGNEGEDTSRSPANVYDSIAVGATNETEDVPSFSSGEVVITDDAWGVDAESDWPDEYTVPDVSAPGEFVLSAVPDDDWSLKSGTSMAAPHVSGTIALMLSNTDDELTPDEVQTYLEDTAVHIGEDKTRQGAGRIDAHNATLAHSRATLSPTVTPDQATISQPTTFAVEYNDHPVDSYHWKFSDGTELTTDEPTVDHTFDEGGTKTVTVTLEDTAGGTVESSQQVTVSPVFAAVSAEQTSDVEVGIDEVTFDASESVSDEEIDHYKWSFSDGRTNVTETPTELHTYTDIGEQTATLTVVDVSGNEQTTRIDIDVVDTTPPVPEITAPAVVVTQSTVSLSAANSTDNHEIESFDWAFGDGTTASGPEVTHAYSETGTKTVTLTATDQSGNENTTSTDIVVQQAPTVSVTDPTDGSFVPDSSVAFEYELLATNSDGADAVEYRLLEASSNESVIEWTDAPFDETESDVSLGTQAESVADGQYTAEFRIVDSAGEPLDFESATDAVTVTIKTTAPTVTLDVESATPEFDQIGPNNPAAIATSVSDPLYDTATLWVENSDGDRVSEWDLSEATGNGTVVSASWNGTDETETPVDSGEYDIGLTATDSIGNADEVIETVTVDTDTPSASVNEIDGGLTHGGTWYANDSTTLNVTVGADDGRKSADGLHDVRLEVDSETANYRLTPELEADTDNGTSYTGSLAAASVDDDGPYSLSVTVTDRANNTAVSSDTPLVFDRSSPELSAVITDVDSATDTATLQVRSTDQLATDPSVTVTQPSGQTIDQTLTQDGDQWTGEFDVTADGTYTLSATGVDLAGNSGSDTATTTVENVSTTNNTATVYSESSGMFIRFNTAEEVDGQTVTMTEANVSPETLTAEQFGVQFLTGELDDMLAAELENATIGIPTTAGSLPASVDSGDDAVSIEYYNDGWESQSTTVETVEVTESVGGEYWTTTVESFSTYGVTVEDTTSPALTETSATLRDDEQTVTLRAEYEDDISGVNRSEVMLLVETDEVGELDVTDNESTAITSSFATHDWEHDGTEEFRLGVMLEDKAGNNDGGEVYWETVSIGSDDSTDGGGGGGGGGGAPTEASPDLRIASFPSPSISAERVETGEPLTVTATLENRGTAIGQETLVLVADGEELTSSTSRVTAGDSREVELNHAFDAPGEYELTIESLSIDSEPIGTVTVTGEPIGAAADDDTDDVVDEEPVSATDDETPGFGFVVAVIGLVGGSLLVRARR